MPAALRISPGLSRRKKVERYLLLTFDKPNSARMNHPVELGHVKKDKFPTLCEMSRDQINLGQFGLPEIFHQSLGNMSFSRVTCCNTSYCNFKEYSLNGRKRSEWMEELDQLVFNFTVKAETSSSYKMRTVFITLFSLSLHYLPYQ